MERHLSRAPDSPNNVGPGYWANPYYQSDAYKEKVAQAQQTELVRQALVRREATPETLAYARFLNAVKNDATLSHGTFKPFKYDDKEVRQDWPHLSDLIPED